MQDITPHAAPARSRKLPASFNVVAVPFVLSLMMSCIVSGISTIASLGLAPDLFHVWMRAWGISWAIAFPTLLLVLPMVRRIVAMVVEQPSVPHH